MITIGRTWRLEGLLNDNYKFENVKIEVEGETLKEANDKLEQCKDEFIAEEKKKNPKKAGELPF